MQVSTLNQVKPTETKLITAKQVQQEYLNMDIRTVRAFLNNNCKYRKIGSKYYYVRAEVEEKLVKADHNVEFSLEKRIPLHKIGRGK